MTHLTIPKVKLNNGTEIPAIGLGTWSGTTREQQLSALPWFLSAIEVGYRHFDTAYGYDTEDVLGDAIRKSGIAREELFVTTKLTNEHHGCVEKGYNESLKRAGLDYYDLYLVHWPQAFPEEGDVQTPDGGWKTVEHPDVNETWAAMEKLYESGKVKAIGVSNFSIKTLTQLLKTAKIIPAVNQVELHPHLQQNDLKKFCDEKGIVLTAYSPTGYAPIREDPTIISLATKHDVSPAQISLAWHVQRGTTAVPKSTKRENQIKNLTQLPKLSEEDMQAIATLDKGTHLCFYPGPKGQVFGWTYEQMGW